MFRRRATTPTLGATSTDAAAITFEAVDAHRGPNLALRKVSLTIETGTTTAVIGANGAGKSSFFALISGRLQPTRGHVAVGGAVAEVMQATAIDDELPLTVDDVVRLGRYPRRGLLGPLRREDRQAVTDAIDAVGLEAQRRRLISALSGGQRQRALVAQGLAQAAPILLLDEPTAGLDVQSQRDVLDLMSAERDRGTTVLFATHDLDEAARADNVIVLACDCVCCAPPDAALTNPAVTELFGPSPTLEPSAEPQTQRGDSPQPTASRANHVA